MLRYLSTIDVKMVSVFLSSFRFLFLSRQALELLVKSQRIFVDFKMAGLKQQSDVEMKLVCREWFEGIDPLFEFRAFVQNSQLTAITQYYK